jgi:hypothetical protein
MMHGQTHIKFKYILFLAATTNDWQRVFCEAGNQILIIFFSEEIRALIG